ncbi:hypothetical protein AVEN_129244-1, partial [Araneus ventricosus]
GSGHPVYVDEKPPDKEVGSRFPKRNNNGVGLSCLHSDHGTHLLRKRSSGMVMAFWTPPFVSVLTS